MTEQPDINREHTHKHTNFPEQDTDCCQGQINVLQSTKQSINFWHSFNPILKSREYVISESDTAKISDWEFILIQDFKDTKIIIMCTVHR